MDIIRLQLENRINGYALLSLDESTLRQFGVSYGFKLTLMSIIENLVHDITFMHNMMMYTAKLLA